MEDLEGLLARLRKAVDDNEVLPSEKMERLLVALAMVRSERQEKAAPFQIIIEAEQAKMAKVVEAYEVADTRIKAGIWECLEVFFDKDTFEGDAGKAKIIRPKNRILYDLKGLEVLRKSSDEVARLIGHLRDEKPSKPYLKVKLK